MSMAASPAVELLQMTPAARGKIACRSPGSAKKMRSAMSTASAARLTASSCEFNSVIERMGLEQQARVPWCVHREAPGHVLDELRDDRETRMIEQLAIARALKYVMAMKRGPAQSTASGKAAVCDDASGRCDGSDSGGYARKAWWGREYS